MSVINLEELTIIIPIYVDTPDRYNNAKSVLGYLNHNLKTNLIIHEIIDSETKLDFLSDFKNLQIKHLTEFRSGGNYHRTRQLNEMLNIVTTKIVCNYDIDVILPIDSYIESYNKIMLGEYDIIYPYGNGQYQKRINKTYNRDKFYELYDINIIDDYDIWSAVCGHCFFIKTDSYKKIGGENEKFIAYGPEDVERYERFEKFNLNLGRIDNYVYHFEHDRMEFSNYMNPNFTDNERLLSYIRSLNNEDLINYYENLDYIKKYKFI